MSEPEREHRAAVKQQKEEQKMLQKQAAQAQAKLLRAESRAKTEKAAGSRAKGERRADVSLQCSVTLRFMSCA